jgi:hypothetical protein
MTKHLKGIAVIIVVVLQTYARSHRHHPQHDQDNEQINRGERHSQTHAS